MVAGQRGRGQLEQAGQRSQGRGQGRPQGQLGGDGANPDGNNGTGRGRGQGGQNAQDRAAERNDDKARNGRGANGNADLVTTIEAILEQLGQVSDL